MEIYTVKDLMEMYDMTRAGIGKSLKDYAEAINADGTNVWQECSKNEWRLTEKGRQIWDAERNKPTNIVQRSKEAEKITELLEENSTLKTQLLIVQEESKTAYKKLADKAEAEKESMKLLSAAEADLKIAEADKYRQQLQLETQANEIARLRTDFEAERKARQDAEARAEAEAKKSWWDKLLGR